MNINNLLMQVVKKNGQLSEQISHRNEEDSRESVERQARDREIAKTLYGGEVKELLERPKDDQLPERILHQNEEDAQEIIEREARDREMAENFHQEELQAQERRKKDDILEQIQERRNTLKSIELQARDRGIAETLYGGEVKELLERPKDDRFPGQKLHQNEEDVRESIEREARDREMAEKFHQEELQAVERRKKDNILEQIQERRNTLKSIELQARDREIAETLYGGEVKELLLERPKDNQLPQQILHQNEEDARETIEREARDREMAEKFHQEELQALERRKKDHIELEARDREIAEKLHQEEVNELEGENTLLADEPWYSDESKEDGKTKTIWKSEVEQLRADVSKMKAARRKSGGGEDDRKAMIQAQATNRKWEEQEEEKEGNEWPVSRSSEFKRNLLKADNSMEDDDEYLPNSKGPKTRGKVSRTTLLPIEPETEDEVTDDTEDHRPIPLRTQANRKPTSCATGSKYDIQPPRRQSEVELLRADVSKMEAARRKIGGDDRRATIQAQANNFKWNKVEEQEGKELSVKRSSKSKRSSLKADDDESSTGPKTRGKVSRTVEPETEDEITDDREDHRPTPLKTKANRKSQGSTSSATGSKSDIRSPRDAYSGVGVPWVINSGVGNTTNSTISNAGNNNSRVYRKWCYYIGVEDNS